MKPSLPDKFRLPTLTLAAHAYEHKRPSGIMSDQTAERWFHQINQQYSDVPLPEFELVNGIIARSMVIDYALLGVIATHQRVAVTDLGCGFSTREYRLNFFDGWWIHVDLPDVLHVRLGMEPRQSSEISIAYDLSDVSNWPLGHDLPEPLALTKRLFILEGLLNHLRREQAEALLSLLHQRYRGHKVIGTVITENGLKGAQSLSADLGLSEAMWAIKDQDELTEVLGGIKLERIWFLGKIASQIGLIRPGTGDEASGLVFLATL